MADVDITSLSVEISAESQGAELNIDKLATAISNLRTKGNVSKVIDGLDKLTNSLAALKSAQGDFSGLEKVTQFIEGISKVNAGESAKSINTLAKSIQKIPDALSGMSDFSDALDSLRDVTDSFNSLSAIQAPKGLSSTINALKKIPDTMSGMDSVNSDLTQTKAVLASFNTLPAVTVPDGLTKMVNTLRRIPTVISETNKADYASLADNIRNVMNALAPLSLLDVSGLKGLGSAFTALDKVPDLTEKLKTADLDAFATACDKISTSLTPLASQLDKVGNAFAKLPPQLSKVVTQANRVTAANEKQRKSYLSLSNQVNSFMRNMAKLVSLKAIADYLGNAVAKFNDFYEATDMFTVSMGEMTESASQFINKMESLLGIDPTEAMNNMANVYSMVHSFGMASDKAYTLSQNITQLGYDLSSLKNMNPAEAFTKLRSAMAGELEPVLQLGVDISQARLQQELLELGFNKQISTLSQADKATLRYIAIMKQLTYVQGNLGETLSSPANMIRMLKAQLNNLARDIGSLLYPALKSILPPLIAAVELIREFVQWVAKLMGDEVTFTDFSKNAGSVGEVGDAMDDTAASTNKAAKALKDYTMGFDELNIIDPTQSDSGSSGSGSGATGNLLGDVDLSAYDMFSKYDEGFGKQIDDIKQKIKDMLPTIGAVGAAFAAWQISKALLDALDKIKNFTINAKIDFSWTSVGLLAFIADMNEFKKYLDDFLKNGPTFKNVAGMISEFAGMMGDALIALGNLKLGGALKVVQGVGEIIIAIKDIADNGLNWDNATTAIRGLTNVAIGIGAFTGHLKVAGWALAIQGFTSIIQEIATNWDAIKNGDWSGVDKATLVIGALEVFGGIATALGVFSKLKAVKESTESVQSVKTVADATQGVSNATSSLSPNLTSLAKNLAVGVAIVAEVSAAAVLFAGAIVVLGNELKAAGDAWQPVISNAKEVAEAVGLGSAALVTVGAATAVIGSAGGVPLATNIGIGTAILAEVGAAAVLFEAEVWAVGTGLDKIQQAWEPVTQNAPAVKTALVAGTALLVAVGAATAAIGAATVASAGTIPIAIGLGTAVLVECAAAFVALTDSISSVADEMTGKLYPSLTNLNGKLPSIKDGMSRLTGYLKDFASELSSYTKSMGSVTWSSIVNGFQKLFAGNPIASLADDVGKIYDDTTTLNEKLSAANPELSKAVRLLTSYSDLMSQLKLLTDGASNTELASDIFTNLEDCGEKLVTGFVSGIDSKLPDLDSEVGKIKTSLDKINDEVSVFETAGGNIVTGLIKGINGEKENAYTAIVEVGNKLAEKFKTAMDIHSPSGLFEGFGEFIDQGLANGITAALPYVTTAMQGVVDAVQEKGQELINAGATQASNYVDGFLNGLDTKWQSIDQSLQTDFFGSLQTLSNAIQNGDLQSLGEWAASYFYHAMDDEQRKQIKSIADNSLTWLTSNLSGVWNSIAGMASSYIGQLVPSTVAATTAQTGLNVAMDANPILFVISLIGMLAGALLGLAGTNSDVAGGISSVWGGLKDFMSYIFEGIVRLLGIYVQGFINGVNIMIGAYNLVAQLWGGQIDYIKNPLFEYADKIAAARENSSSVDSLASGNLDYSSVPGTSEYEQASGSGSSVASYTRSAELTPSELRDAVKEGFVSALQESGFGDTDNGNFTVRVYLDGKEITSAVEKRQSDRGMSLMGTEAYSY